MAPPTPLGSPDTDRAEAAFREFIAALGLDPLHPELKDSPKRAARVWLETLTAGHHQSLDLRPADRIDAGEGRGNPVLALDVPLMCVCPHHLLPARGHAHLAYIPKDHIVGFGVLFRWVETTSRRLILQEDLAQLLANTLWTGLEPLAVAVQLELEHGCIGAEQLSHAPTRIVTQAQRGPERQVESLVRSIDAKVRPGE